MSGQNTEMPWRRADRPTGGGAHADWKVGATCRGFTLLEILLAVAVFSIVLVAVHGVFYGALRLRNRTVEALDTSLPLQQALAIIKRDLAGVVLPGGRLFGEFQTTPTPTTNVTESANQFASTFTAPGPGSLAQGLASPRFSTATGIVSDRAPWGEVSRVYYYLATPTNVTDAPGLDLVRSVTRNLLPAIQEETEEQWLMGGVASVFFTYYDGMAWVESWDSTTATTRLPLAVKVELQLAAGETDRAMREPIELVVPLMVQASTNETASVTEEVE